MMEQIKATGIIAEYNPFHNGHLYQLQEAKKLGKPIVVVMSGHVMQRGELPCLDKWTRAKLAVEYGASLVLQLPESFSIRSAQYFAEGGVQLLNSLGCVNTLVCGTEHPALPFKEMAELLQSAKAQEFIHETVQKGISYAKAVEELLADLLCKQSLKGSNDILALEYTKAVLKYKAQMELVYLQRKGSSYNDQELHTALASATAIRKAWEAGEDVSAYVPEKTRQSLTAGYIKNTEVRLWLLVKYMLLSAPDPKASLVPELENIMEKHYDAPNLKSFVEACTTKRFPASRVRRYLLQRLLPAISPSDRPYVIRPLAFDAAGRKILKYAKNYCDIPIVTKIADFKLENDDYISQCANVQLQESIVAADFYALVHECPSGLDFTISPYYKKEISSNDK